MKDFWKDFFFDIDECGYGKETAAEAYGQEICNHLQEIEDAIKSFETNKALELITELKEYY